MKTSSLELLEKNQLPPAQALAILQVMELELEARGQGLVTKSDLREFEGRLESRFESRFNGLELKIEGLRGELKSDIQATVRWNFAFWVVQLSAIAGLLKLLK